MHAALLTLTIDPDQAPAAADALTRDILPKIRSAPGFVAGYWLEPVDGRGFSFVVFETEEQARRSAPPASNWAAPGVSINEVDFRRVPALRCLARPRVPRHPLGPNSTPGHSEMTS
jgi:hypothetical protein